MQTPLGEMISESAQNYQKCIFGSISRPRQKNVFKMSQVHPRCQKMSNKCPENAPGNFKNILKMAPTWLMAESVLKKCPPHPAPPIPKGFTQFK